MLQSLANSFVFDWLLRLKSAANVSLFILEGVPVLQPSTELERFLVHASLVLSANSESYLPLWREQLPGVQAPSWPVMADLDQRWILRSRVDAAVAHGYGRTRPQYEHVLDGFPHTSNLNGKDLCLGAFDELTMNGLGRFVRDHDPYHHVPVVRSLPEPVLKLVDDLEGGEVQVKKVTGRKKKQAG